MGCSMAIVTHNDVDCTCEMNFLTKKAKLKEQRKNEKNIQEKELKKRKREKEKKEERRRNFFRKLSVALESTSSVGRARSGYGAGPIIQLILETIGNRKGDCA